MARYLDHSSLQLRDIHPGRPIVRRALGDGSVLAEAAAGLFLSRSLGDRRSLAFPHPRPAVAHARSELLGIDKFDAGFAEWLRERSVTALLGEQ